MSIYSTGGKSSRKSVPKPITVPTVTGRRVKRRKVAKSTKSSKPLAAAKPKKSAKARKSTAPAKKSKPLTTSNKKKAAVIKPKSTAKRRAIPPAKRAKHRVVSTTKKSVKFSLDAPTGLNVAVSGSFNSWVPQAMTKGPDGLWAITLHLVPGAYLYRFLVDAEWQDDPSNLRKTVDLMHGFCSVCEVL